MWSKYASRFHSDVNCDLPADVSSRFNYSLFDYIHHALLNSLQEKQDLVQKEALQHSWDQFSDLLCRVDAATACHGWITQNHFVTFLFDIWKVSSQFTIPVTLSTIAYTFRILEISRWPHKNRKYL
jgi:hypothetical protein